VGGGFARPAPIDFLSRGGFFPKLAPAGGKKGTPPPPHLLAPQPPPLPAPAKHAAFPFIKRAPSPFRTLYPKPSPTKFHGTPYHGDTPVGSNGRPIGHLMQTPFSFRPHGQSGLPISSLYPHVSQHADDLCVFRSLYTDTAAHASGCLQMNTGSVQIG